MFEAGCTRINTVIQQYDKVRCDLCIWTTVVGRHGANIFRNCERIEPKHIKTHLLICCQKFTRSKNKKKGGTEGTESSSFWLHHCVKCQRKQDACLSFSDFLHVKVSQSTGEFVLVNVLVLRVVFEGAVWSRAARGPPEEALLPERAATTERNNLLLQDSTVRDECHTHTLQISKWTHTNTVNVKLLLTATSSRWNNEIRPTI